MIRIRGRSVNQRLGTGPGARLAGVLAAAILISGLASACRPGQGDEARPLTSIEFGARPTHSAGGGPVFRSRMAAYSLLARGRT